MHLSSTLETCVCSDDHIVTMEILGIHGSLTMIATSGYQAKCSYKTIARRDFWDAICKLAIIIYEKLQLLMPLGCSI